MTNRYAIQGDILLINVWYKSFSLCALANVSDLPKLMTRHVQWYAGPAKAPKGKWYAWAKFWNTETKKSRTVALHRFIMDEPKDMDVHHIDNDGLNCKRSNLEILTHKENSRRSEMCRAVDWQTIDALNEIRESRARELAAIREIIAITGYTRQYVWQVRNGRHNNAALTAMLDAIPKRLPSTIVNIASEIQKLRDFNE